VRTGRYRPRFPPALVLVNNAGFQHVAPVEEFPEEVWQRMLQVMLQVVQTVMLAPAAIQRLIEPEEVASLAAYLCSEEASAVTGAVWTIDLGWTAR
jgi:NAD(P)-dependent dehydrogenase (short-subunit alcohol dehydrogenase family)